MCIDIMEIWFGIARGQISSIFDRVICQQQSVFVCQDNSFSKSQQIFTTFDMCIDTMEIWFGIAHWQILSIFDRTMCPRHDNDGLL